MAYKKGLFWCESQICQGSNLVSPRSYERKCVFCGEISNLDRDSEFEFRPDRSKFTLIFDDKFNPFMNFIRWEFAREPNLDTLGIEVGVKKYQAGKRVRFSLIVRKGPVYEIRKGFEFGALNGGWNNRFAIPTATEREGAGEDLGAYSRNFISKDTKPLVPSFEDKSFLLGPETEFLASIPVSLWGEN